jgi:hypothetical protein|uniref:Uncharacterized protein n=1 Tax=Candidatus Methanophaga sp. ANME-1 ERB7 TaxID=2759913 RepID=A0A7G9ZAD7_9EURY|nr:hypothetical protein ALKFPMEL_00003 [Methanosarcinales archaeon ANME-1 ERB7]
MGTKFSSAMKCFIRCPACTLKLLRNFGSLDPETTALLREVCPDFEEESAGYYFGLFMGAVFVILCVIAYLFLYVFRAVWEEILFIP